jgi:hypothetical protein
VNGISKRLMVSQLESRALQISWKPRASRTLCPTEEAAWVVRGISPPLRTAPLRIRPAIVLYKLALGLEHLFDGNERKSVDGDRNENSPGKGGSTWVSCLDAGYRPARSGAALDPIQTGSTSCATADHFGFYIPSLEVDKPNRERRSHKGEDHREPSGIDTASRAAFQARDDRRSHSEQSVPEASPDR